RPAGNEFTPGHELNDPGHPRHPAANLSVRARPRHHRQPRGPGTPTCSGGSCPDGGSSLKDCDDGNANAHPGQMFYFDTPRDGGSFDYDCDGTEKKDPYWDCLTGYAGTAICSATKYTGQRGFVGASPGCGDAGLF